MSNLGDILRQVVCTPKHIPDDWQLYKLTDICSPKQWKTISSTEMTESGYPVFGANGFVGFYHEYNHEHEAVAITCRGNTCGTINRIPPRTYITGNSMALDDIKNDVITQDFLYYALKYRGVGDSISGSAQPQITGAGLRSIEFPAPPLPEQQKIATILSSVDNVIEKTRAQIDKLKDLKTGMMQELLTKGIGHTEFKDSPVGRIPLSWSIAELRDVCTSKYAVVDGPFGSNLKTEHYRPTGIPVFQSGFVTSGRFVKREYVYVDAEKYNEQIRSSAGQGDILMAKIGMNAGACAIIPEDHSVGILAGNSLKITVDIDKISNTYLLSILHLMRYTGEMRRLLTETAQPAVSITTLKSLKLALPPLPEQHEITAALNSIDSKYTSIAEKLAHLKQIKKALMQDLLTGKVRVNLTDKESAVV